MDGLRRRPRRCVCKIMMWPKRITNSNQQPNQQPSTKPTVQNKVNRIETWKNTQKISTNIPEQKLTKKKKKLQKNNWKSYEMALTKRIKCFKYMVYCYIVLLAVSILNKYNKNIWTNKWGRLWEKRKYKTSMENNNENMVAQRIYVYVHMYVCVNICVHIH